jgi:lipopolysaccharide transport system ATP-binding protein
MLLGATKNEINARMDDIIAFSELNGFFDELLGTYSTGMRARLGFSVAYFVNPDIILLDEVLGVGDQAFSIKSTEAMKNRIKSDKTVVLVSHNIPLVKEVCDRLLWIENGITMAQGNVSEVVKKYLDFVNS